ncbi:Lipase [Leishmania braziliensis]|nr:Lipase [Leishmania braziliensis]
MKRDWTTVAVIAAVLLAAVAHAGKQAMPYLYSEAYRSHNYARASYCAASTLLNWSCGSVCNMIPGFKPYTTFYSSKYNTFGFAGVDTSNQQIVLAFRGSNSATNWLYSLTFLFREYNTSSSCGKGCQVHLGFYASYLSLQSQVRAAVSELVTKFPDYQVLVTGHSLGGALAVHAAVDLQEQFNSMWKPGKPVALYTLGAPRVGNPTFARWTAQILARGPHYRITHCRDPVPHLPPMSFGFLHAPTEVFYRTRANDSMVICNDSSVAESRKCSNNMLPISIMDHLRYFGESTGCSCDTCAGSRSIESQATMPKWLYARLIWEHLKSGGGMWSTATLQ